MWLCVVEHSSCGNAYSNALASNTSGAAANAAAAAATAAAQHDYTFNFRTPCAFRPQLA